MVTNHTMLLRQKILVVSNFKDRVTQIVGGYVQGHVEVVMNIMADAGRSTDHRQQQRHLEMCQEKCQDSLFKPELYG